MRSRESHMPVNHSTIALDRLPQFGDLSVMTSMKYILWYSILGMYDSLK